VRTVGERKPSVYVLCLLAGVYDTDVLCLLDLADHESLPQQDRLVLMRRLPVETTFGERVLALLEARGLSLRELPAGCRATPRTCRRSSTAGSGRPSLRVAARLDDLLEAGGNWSRSRRRPRRHRTTPLNRGKTPASRPARGGP
jgi:hypothetical protein